MDILIKSLSNIDSQTIIESEEVLQMDNFIKEHATKYNLLSENPDLDNQYIQLTSSILNNRVRHQLDAEALRSQSLIPQ